MRCPNCNAFVGEDEMFCGECGARIGRPPAASPAAEPVPAKKAGGPRAALLGGGAAVVGIIVLVVVACLCLVVGVIALGVCTPAPEPTFTPTRTATHVAQATQTPTPRPPTVTPRPPTPTFRPSPTATVTPRPAAPAVTGSVFKEGFDADASGWNVGTGTRGKRYIQDGELHIELTQDNSIVWCSHSKNDWADMVLEVDARQVAGSDNNDYGVAFRYQDTNNFYRFVITSEGRYRMSKYVNGQWTALIDWRSSPAIKKGAATNHIKVICKGPTFELYVNGEKLGTVEDDDLDKGAIAMIAGSYDQPDVHIAFDNVLAIPGSPAFYDDFVDNRNNWPERTDIAFLKDGEYHIYDQNAAHAFWSTTAGRFGDAVIEARIRKVEGADDMAYGVVFRAQDLSNFYNFVLIGDGRYAVGKRKAGQWEFVIFPKASEAVNKGNSVNILRVVCTGASFEFYVNGQKVDSAQDDFLSEGYVGFHADEDVHLAADNVVVWTE